MLPAHERFEADGAARSQIDNRLVLESELAGFECATQVRLELQAAYDVGAQVRLEDAEPRFAAAFGGVHGNVGLAEEFLYPIRFRTGGDADARGDKDLGGRQHDRCSE